MNVSRSFAAAPRSVALRLAPVNARFLPCLPVILLIVALLFSYLAKIPLPFGEERPFAKGISRHDAVQSAEMLCARLAKSPAKMVFAHPVSIPVNKRPQTHCEWQIVCHAGTDDYFLRFEATAPRLVSVQREIRAHHPRPFAQPPFGVNRAAALTLAKRYLFAAKLIPQTDAATLEKITLQDKNRNAWDAYFHCPGEKGRSRRVRVCLSAETGDLNLLQSLCLLRPSSAR